MNKNDLRKMIREEILKEISKSQIKALSKKMEDLDDDEDWEAIQGKPNKVVRTGISNMDGAPELHIYYANGYTYVSPVGEYQNSDPWKYKGKINPALIKAEYVEFGTGEFY